jgi:hypothetical protein
LYFRSTTSWPALFSVFKLSLRLSSPLRIKTS